MYVPSSEYKATRCKAVDMVLEAVGFYKKCNRPLKSITLSKYNWDQFDSYMKSNFCGDLEVDTRITPYTIEGIEIIKAESSLVKNIHFEFWPNRRSEANDEKYFTK